MNPGRYFLFLLFIGFLSISDVAAQSTVCDSVTPKFIVDLSQDPNGTYISPLVVRNGFCCGSTGNVKCIEFSVTLHPDAEGVIFDIYSGAVPGGALFYQINCNPPSPVGAPICLSGQGPHLITFCKPGNNINEYRIISVAEPIIPDSTYVNDGCSKEIGTIGFEETSIQWNTVFPGLPGAFNHYLNCTAGCDTVIVTPQVGYPPYMDIEVCGYPFGGCDTIYTCDTVRVKFFSTLAVDILPEFPTVCFGDSGTFIYASPSGGSPPYTYNWSTLENTDSIFVNTGTYWVELWDTSGCPPTYDTVTVTSYSLPIEAIAGNDTFMCVENKQVVLNGKVISASGGTWVGKGTFAPSNDSLSTLYTPTALEVASGFANLRLITTGNGSCPADTDVIQVSLFKFVADLSLGAIPVSCKGNADGMAIALATGTRAPFTYTWDAQTGNQVNDSALNLTAGTYGLIVSDSAGCIVDTTVVVVEADSVLTLSITTTPVTCFDSADGTATLTINGGATPYLINWDLRITSISGTTALNLFPDTFSLSITDSYGCEIDTFFIVDGPTAPLSLVMSKVDIGCKDGTDGSATASVSGGTQPYTYLWDDSTGFQTTPTAVNLKIGNYSVIVTDTMGCIISDSISLIEPVSAIQFTDTFTAPSCYGFNDGTATVFPTGGTPPYTYLWDSTALNQTTQTATGLSAGTYTVIIYDQNSCLFASPIVVIDPMPLFATAVEIVNVSCKGGANGSAKVTPTGGTPPYTFQWDSASGGQTDSIAINLPAGVYSILVHDQFGCSYIPGIEILEPDDSLIVNTGNVSVSCKGGSDGKAIAIPFGGTPPYLIQWNAAANNQTTDTAIGLSAGVYLVNVTDSNGCIADSLVQVIEPNTLLISQLFSQSPLCFGDSNGLAAVTQSGGVSPYTVVWDAQTGNQTGDTARNIGSGIYQVVITDDNNCVIDTQVTVTDPLALVLSGDQRDVFCYGEMTAWAFVSPAGGTSPYFFQWDSASGFQTGDSALNLPAGIHKVTVTDDHGCSRDSSFVIAQPAGPIFLNPGAEDVDCFGDSNGLAYVQVTGGTSPYSYQWGANANSQTTDTAFNLKAGVYMITVTDSLGCSDNFPVTVSEPAAPLQMVLVGKHVTCFEGTNGKAWLNYKNGGTLPYSYSWNTTVGHQTGDTAINLKAGKIYLKLTDANGCNIEDSINLAQPTEVILTLSNSDTICIGGSHDIFGNASGGNGGPYSFKLLPTFTLITFPYTVTPVATKTFGLRAFDVLGCTSETEVITVYVRDLLKDSIDVTKSGNVCLGDTVFIQGHHSGIYPGYDYLWNSGQLSLQFNDRPSKSRYYTLKISDDCALSIKDSVYVEVYPLPQLALDDEIAAGCIPLTVGFGNQVQDPSITSYLWELGDSITSIDPNPVHTYQVPGRYTIRLRVTNGFGCHAQNDTSNYVEAYSLPKASFISNPPIVDERSPVIQFISTSTPNIEALKHSWKFEDGKESSKQNPVHFFADSGSYFVQLLVVDENGCADSSITAVIIEPYFNLNIPNAFTPYTGGGNGGRYDPNATNNFIFYPHTEGVSEYEMQIFNRWGELIFESKDHSIGWDGYYRGKMASQEVYVWKIKIKWENGQDYEGVGDVTLFR